MWCSFALAPEEHLVVFTGHHIVVDGWSWAVLVPDWGASTARASGGEAPALPPADRFSEYAKEQAGREGTTNSRLTKSTGSPSSRAK